MADKQWSMKGRKVFGFLFLSILSTICFCVALIFNPESANVLGVGLFGNYVLYYAVFVGGNTLDKITKMKAKNEE